MSYLKYNSLQKQLHGKVARFLKYIMEGSSNWTVFLINLTYNYLIYIIQSTKNFRTDII